MHGFLGARVPFSECPVFLGNQWSHRAASLFHQARVKLFEIVDYSQGKRRPTWEGLARDLRGKCEGTDTGEEREVFTELG